MEKTYIMWSDGTLSSMGELKSRELDGTLKILNPAHIVFMTEETPILDEKGEPTLDENGLPRYRGTLRWEITPYIFGACLQKDTENLWTITPKYILENNTFEPMIIENYEHIIRVCGPKA